MEDIHHYVLVGGRREMRMIAEAVKAGKGVDARDSDGNTPLHTAAALGNIRICAVLVEQGADILALDAGGRTPFRIAEDAGHHELATLFENEADRQGL